MALMTPEQFEASIEEMKPRVFMNGKLVDNILENKNTRTVVEANKASYAWALDPKYDDIMSCKIMLQRVIDYERDKNIVKQTLDLNEN